MVYIVQAAPPCEIVDTNAKLGVAALQAVLNAGYAGVARYLPLPRNNAGGDISADELRAILDAGLGLLLVQHVRSPPWNPANHSGEEDAQAALQLARDVGYLPGAHIFLDLEGIVPGSAEATKAFAEAWAKAVVTAGYLAGCYVGYDVPLNAQQLYDLHSVTSYWSDAGPRRVATRGFAMKQHAEIAIAGVKFDPDTIASDLCEETPMWMVAGEDDPSVA